ncbi:BON domain-containing protein [Flavobacterium chilense]|uniref:Osmotically-inducible protein OsmY, contains BON domain n=1 Tax=Flavobacterium chilense TaxID=946677 RepID=A0A1M7A178_9FLAO|nr:BON domain-containing protein [Flavobacterium chilense]SHL36410.1 Osmotically-inducible protein OsmY, contains BON domain [Flavobacterium chilense]
MKKNEILQRDVLDAIKWETQLNTSQIEVTANNGIVTLKGIVDLPAKKIKAKDTAKQVPGVLEVFENIQVKINSREQKNDCDIAQAVLNAFRWNWNTLNDSIEVKVENGHVTLSGELEWHYQKEAAARAVTNLIGVKTVNNNIIIDSRLSHPINKEIIKRALKNHVAIHTASIRVEVSGNEVTLEGAVDSRYQKELAEKITWKTPGVRNIKNNLKVIAEHIDKTLDVFYKMTH